MTRLLTECVNNKILYIYSRITKQVSTSGPLHLLFPLDCSSPRLSIYKAHSSTSFKPIFKGHLLSKAFPDDSIKRAFQPLTATPCDLFFHLPCFIFFVYTLSLTIRQSEKSMYEYAYMLIQHISIYLLSVPCLARL